MRNALIVLLIVGLSILAACKAREPAGEEPMEPKQVTQDQTPQSAAANYEVMPGDTVVLELSIYHPRHIYLTSKEPVVVLAPFDSGYTFEKKRYTLVQSRFPMFIKFKVSRTAPRGQTSLKMAMQVTYAEKADESVHTRNVLLDVPLNIMEIQSGRRTRIQRIPVEHFLDVTPKVVN